MARTSEEKDLLKKLGEGLLDGLVGDDLTTSGGSSVWMVIRDGIPRRLKEGPGSKHFDNRETIRIPGVRHVLQEWLSDEEKLEFLQKFGWLMKDEAVRAYSAKFKPKR